MQDVPQLQIEMKAGVLKEVVELWKPVNTLTEYGEHTEEYTFVCKTRSAVDYVNGYRMASNNEMFYPSSCTFLLRHYIPVQEPMRIKYRDRFYQITSVKHDLNYHNILVTADLVNL